MKKISRFMMAAFVATLALASCDKDSDFENGDQGEVVKPGDNEGENEGDNENPDVPTLPENVYALTEGNFYQHIEGGLNVLNLEKGSVDMNVFKATNGRSLGDTPQCGVAYGSKIYVGASESNTIEIIDRLTWKSVKQINVADVTPGGQPYSMVASKGKVFISMFGGNLARLDTLTMTIDKVVPVGNNPDQIALYKDKIYVPISDGMNYPNYGTTAVVVDPVSMEIEKTFETGLNPREFIVADEHLYVLCMGNYGDVPSKLYEVSSDFTLKEICDATLVATYDKKVAIINQPFTQGEPIVEYKLYDPANETLTDWDIVRPDYANSMFYDIEAGTFFIASYVMNGQYPSYELPGYVNQYKVGSKEVVKKYELGSAGRTHFFTLQK